MLVPQFRQWTTPFGRWPWDVESPLITPIAETLDLTGGVVAMAVFAAVIAAVLWRRSRKVSAIVWLVTMILGQGFSSLLKLAYERPRPPMPLHLESTWSFPSGHTLTAAIVGAGLTYLFSGGPAAKTIAWVWVVGDGGKQALSESPLDVRRGCWRPHRVRGGARSVPVCVNETQ